MEYSSKKIGDFLHLCWLHIDNFEGLPRPINDNYQVTTSDYYMNQLLSLIFKPRYNYLDKKQNGYYVVDNEVFNNMEIFTYFDPIRPNNEYSLNRLNQYFKQVDQMPITELKHWKNID